ncbi:MAG: hypothetical protein QXX38_00505 [Candidatus Aenigmatarchaeota archaeon]
MEIFKINERTVENTKKILRIAAIILGLKYGIKDGKIVIIKCPFNESFKGEPFFCNICIEYCRGAVEEILGSNFIFKRHRRLIDGDEYCDSTISEVKA